MNVEPWLYGFALVLFAFHVISLIYAVRLRNAAREASGNADEAVTGSIVECPSCGAENEARYRFCRSCIEELPGTYVGRGHRSAPRGRGMY